MIGENISVSVQSTFIYSDQWDVNFVIESILLKVFERDQHEIHQDHREGKTA